MKHPIDIIVVSKKHNVLYNKRLPLGSIIVLSILCFIITLSAIVLFFHRAHGALVKSNTTEIEHENAVLLQRLDSLRQVLSYTQDNFEHHIQQDNRERTLWRMAYIHPDIWSMGIGGTSYEAPNKYMSRHTHRMLNEIYESIDVLKGKCLLRTASLKEIEDQIERNLRLWEHIPSINPVPGGRFCSGFGKRIDPIDKKTIRMHWGIDIGTRRGKPIYVTADGVVSFTGWVKGYGWTVDIDHGFGFRTRYAHCNRILVEKGDAVERGQVIATVGSSGRSISPHLHYEVHVSGVKVNPANYINLSNVILD
jgi:hypothetical protein